MVSSLFCTPRLGTEQMLSSKLEEAACLCPHQGQVGLPGWGEDGEVHDEVSQAETGQPLHCRCTSTGSEKGLLSH